MGVNHMTGTPWHLKTLRKNDDRRDKRNCVFFCKDRCFFLCEQCRGSAHCDYYREKESETKIAVQDKSERSTLGYIGRPVKKPARKLSPLPDITSLFHVGDKIEYRDPKSGYSKRYKYKSAVIKEVRENAIRVEFTSQSGQVHTQVLHYPEILSFIR